MKLFVYQKNRKRQFSYFQFKVKNYRRNRQKSITETINRKELDKNMLLDRFLFYTKLSQNFEKGRIM